MTEFYHKEKTGTKERAPLKLKDERWPGSWGREGLCQPMEAVCKTQGQERPWSCVLKL